LHAARAMTTPLPPAGRELSAEEADALLARNTVGRIAFCWENRVDIEPIHYVYDAPWIFGRTRVGAKLVALAHNQWCAFETDESTGRFDWASVVVKGPFTALNSAIGQSDKYDRAVTALRKIHPEIFTENDPVPERTVVFGIYANEISARAMSTS
jgi:nitroimidazol reductase NimA-like FMN-containing flavoprotein (pyridoxamine 5'-phosphate oxidase superfamily)